MPAGVDVTVPAPLPALVTVRVNRCRVNVAVTLVAASILTVHVPEPVQPAPDQPTKVAPTAGVAVRVTSWLKLKFALQVGGQSMPGGLEVMRPAPLPAPETLSAKRRNVNCAVTRTAWVRVVVQVPVPVQAPPDQPVNVEPAAGVAVSVTDWPKLKSAAHVAPQLMPVGFDVTAPAA